MEGSYEEVRKRRGNNYYSIKFKIIFKKKRNRLSKPWKASL